MGINTAIDAELAYRRERISEHFRPWRRVGAERRAAARRSGTTQPPQGMAASVISISR